VELDITMLCEVSQAQKDKYHVVSLVWKVKQLIS
jgi:hypothetical protein